MVPLQISPSNRISLFSRCCRNISLGETQHHFRFTFFGIPIHESYKSSRSPVYTFFLGCRQKCYFCYFSLCQERLKDCFAHSSTLIRNWLRLLPCGYRYKVQILVIWWIFWYTAHPLSRLSSPQCGFGMMRPKYKLRSDWNEARHAKLRSLAASSVQIVMYRYSVETFMGHRPFVDQHISENNLFWRIPSL